MQQYPLLAVVGQVGAGKSSLLQCLLGELNLLDGSIEMKGRVSYASQESWIFSATLRENVLFGKLYDQQRYNTVLEACALDKVQQWLVF
jgi:ATP-binding cassette subfamily C (CFTR/MRP) protein 4